MALFPSSALERAMQIKEVLMRAMNKEYSWLQAADILGITPRGLRRLRKRMEEFGYQGLVDMRRGRPSPRRTPVAEVERILELYRERYSGFNAKHFFDMVRLRHGVAVLRVREADPAGRWVGEEIPVSRASSSPAGTQGELWGDAAYRWQPT